MVEVARKTSMITTTLLLRSYKCSSAGDKEVWRLGLLLMEITTKIKERELINPGLNRGL
jgi:hypothetical protein